MSHGNFLQPIPGVSNTPIARMRGARAIDFRIALWMAAVISLAGCGGAPSPGAMPDSTDTVARTSKAQRGEATGIGATETHRQSGAVAAQASPAPPLDLILLNGRVVHQDLDQLDPRRGKGYEALQAFIYARGRPRASSPVAGVKPICLQPTVCEYLPPRKAGLAERYIVSIPDGSVAALSADEDRVVINPRQLALEKPATVDVTLEIPGQPPIVKRIVYGAAPVG